MAFAEINLHVINVLLQSDWLAQNLELEPLNPGSNVSFPLLANFSMRMHIRGKIRLARETSVRACVCACVRVCVFVRCCVRVCVCVAHHFFQPRKAIVTVRERENQNVTYKVFVRVFNSMCVLS